jgi:hypothetical protein
MSKAELLLEVMAEGGSIAIYGRREGDRMLYRVGVVDQTLTFLDEDEADAEIRSDSGWLNTWEAAVAAIGRWSWPNLYPRVVHPSIGDRVWKAVQNYTDYAGRGVREEARRRWRSKCIDTDTENP